MLSVKKLERRFKPRVKKEAFHLRMKPPRKVIFRTCLKLIGSGKSIKICFSNRIQKAQLASSNSNNTKR